MLPFIDASPAELAHLKRRAAGKCLRFRDCPMPTGSQPPRADVGIEITASGSKLYVERRIRYPGDNAAIQEWLRAGEKSFVSFEALVQWLRETLAPACAGTPAPVGPVIDRTVLLEQLQKEVRGQDEALGYLAEAVARHTARTAPRRPATFFAIGPTGVGKTRTAETLAAALRTLDPMVAYLRLDMTEFQERHRVSQLFGAPPGYIGYGDRTALLDTLRAYLRALVLLDEIEKAHPDVLLSLMNILDAGRITPAVSSPGEGTIDCRKAIFFFTTNLLAEEIGDDLEEQSVLSQPNGMDAICRRRLVEAGLRRELVGRIHHFLVFQPLSLDARAEILALAITRVAAEYGLQVVRSAPGVILALLKQARQEGFGARPDEYLVERVLGDCFAETARLWGAAPVEVQGPPFRCVPCYSASPAPPW